MTYFKFYFTTNLNQSLSLKDYCIIPSSLLKEPSEDLLLFLNQLPCFTIFEDEELSFEILSLYIFQNNFFRIKNIPHFFSSKTIQEKEYCTISPDQLTSDGEFDKMRFLEKLDQENQFLFSNDNSWLVDFEHSFFSKTEQMLLKSTSDKAGDLEKSGLQIENLEFHLKLAKDSLNANKSEAQKEIDFYKKKANDLETYFKTEIKNQELFYKEEIEKTKVWAQKNPDLNFIEKLKLFFK